MSAETTAPQPDPANWLAYNRANWDERVPIHVGGTFYNLDSFVAGRETLADFERSARVAASMVKPGGFLYVAESHPFGNTLSGDDGRRRGRT